MTIKLQTLEYKEGDQMLEGFFAYDDSITGMRPGVVVVPEFNGINENTHNTCKKLAEEGFLAFAADIYGKGVRPKSADAAAAETIKYRNDRPLWRKRIQAAFEQLKGHEFSDISRLAAIGFCFGGETCLELARHGTKLNGVVSFHGQLFSPKPEDAKNIQTRILVCHGALDQRVNAQVKGFFEEMNAADVDYQFIQYSRTAHSFTNPKAGNDSSSGTAYNEQSAARSWKAMHQFFNEIFA